MFRIAVDADIDLALIQPSMAEELYQLIDANRIYLSEWLSWLEVTQSSKDTGKFIEESISGFTKDQILVCVIEYQNNLAGVIGFNSISKTLKKVELGYWVAEDMQGKGIARRACTAIINYAFEEMGIEKIEIHVATENHPSQKLCESLGAQQEGLITQAEDINERTVDHIYYAINKTRLAWQKPVE